MGKNIAFRPENPRWDQIPKRDDKRPRHSYVRDSPGLTIWLYLHTINQIYGAIFSWIPLGWVGKWLQFKWITVYCLNLQDPPAWAFQMTSKWGCVQPLLGSRQSTLWREPHSSYWPSYIRHSLQHRKRAFNNQALASSIKKFLFDKKYNNYCKPDWLMHVLQDQLIMNHFPAVITIIMVL